MKKPPTPRWLFSFQYVFCLLYRILVIHINYQLGCDWNALQNPTQTNEMIRRIGYFNSSQKEPESGICYLILKPSTRTQFKRKKKLGTQFRNQGAWEQEYHDGILAKKEEKKRSIHFYFAPCNKIKFKVLNMKRQKCAETVGSDLPTSHKRWGKKRKGKTLNTWKNIMVIVRLRRSNMSAWFAYNVCSSSPAK